MGDELSIIDIIIKMTEILFDRVKILVWIVIALLLLEVAFIIALKERTSVYRNVDSVNDLKQHVHQNSDLWRAPDTTDIPNDETGQLIAYGRELIEHTALYLGPQGKVAQISNGMNCQNCHLHAGTKPFAANYSAVASTYPRFRQRSGIVEDFEKRVNDCFERSMNGSPLPRSSRELQSIIAYLKWLGRDVAKGVTPKGAGLIKLSMLTRRADTLKGKKNYFVSCASCHGVNGEGIKADNQNEWQYPPLWGANSYNTGAGLYRISTFARFIKANMPYGISYKMPVLSDEEAWDIAAFVNSMPRPHKDFADDWPNLMHKPIDHPFGPYADNFSEEVHKYGPFHKILNAKNK